MSLSSHDRRELLAEPFPPRWQSYLDENVFLYQLLTEQERTRLRNAVRILIAEKFWEGCAGLHITDEIQVTIAGQAGLLLLGLDDYYFDELKTILVYPGGFLAPVPGAWDDEGRLQSRLGESHWGGPVVLSWWQSRWDGRRPGRSNLVIHEFAHKLAESGEPHDGTPPLEDPDLAERWEAVMQAEYEQLVDDAAYQRPNLLDPYGAENRAEFFSVASECFFLQPTDMRQRHRQLYDLLAEFYCQDPASRPVDEAFTRRQRDAEDEYSRHVIGECSAAIKRQPDCADAYAQRASWYCARGEFDSAVQDGSAVIRLASRHERAQAYYERGSICLAAGWHDRAIADFSEAIRREPAFPQAYRDRGAARAAKGEQGAALADLTRALRLDPKDDKAYIERAMVYHALGKPDKAVRDLTRAIGLSPLDAVAYNNRAWVQLSRQEYDLAIADCNEALRLDPDMPEPYKHRGVAYLQKGAYRQALVDLGEAIRIAADYAEAYRHRANAFVGLGEAEKAAQDRSQADNLEQGSLPDSSGGDP